MDVLLDDIEFDASELSAAQEEVQRVSIAHSLTENSVVNVCIICVEAAVRSKQCPSARIEREGRC